jgi:hypothetical protein
LREFENPWHEKPVDSDAGFENAVEQKIVFAAIGYLAEKITADGKPRHESRQNRRDGVRRVAENLRQHPRPYHLVNQTRGAGKKEAEQSDQQQPVLVGALNAIAHRVSQFLEKRIQRVIASRW